MSSGSVGIFKFKNLLSSFYSSTLNFLVQSLDKSFLKPETEKY